MNAIRKGIPRDFVDGAGLCSPGRWPVKQRVLPDDYTCKRISKVLKEGLQKCVKAMKEEDPKMDVKYLLVRLALGQYAASPFDSVILQYILDDLRIICKQAGHGDGLPLDGDVVQPFEVRLIQRLLSAFGDPYHHMCHWLARAAWLGSAERKLPRPPAVFDRKLKWRNLEPTDEMHQGWQTN